MEEALLNGDTTEFYQYIDSDNFKVETLGLEAKIYYHYYNNQNCSSLVQQWVSLPGDLRLFELCSHFDDFIDDLIHNLNHREMLRNKTLTGVTPHSFTRLCYFNYMEDPEYLNKLIIIQEPFSELGLLHKQLLKKSLFREYLELSARYPFIPNIQWTKDVESCYTNRYFLTDFIEYKFGLRKHDSVMYDINTLREKDIFPDLYHKVYLEHDEYHQRGMRDKVLSCFDQLLFEERTLWVNILKPSLNIYSLQMVHDKDTFNTLIEFIDISGLKDGRVPCYYFNYFANNYCLIVLESIMEHVSENVANKLKLWVMLHFNEVKVKHFFGEVTQESIDNLVRQLV